MKHIALLIFAYNLYDLSGLVVTQPGGVQPVPVGVSFPPAFGGVPQQPTNFNPNQYHPLYEQRLENFFKNILVKNDLNCK